MSCWPYIQSDLYRYAGKVSVYLVLKHGRFVQNRWPVKPA